MWPLLNGRRKVYPFFILSFRLNEPLGIYQKIKSHIKFTILKNKVTFLKTLLIEEINVRIVLHIYKHIEITEKNAIMIIFLRDYLNTNNFSFILNRGV